MFLRRETPAGVERGHHRLSTGLPFPKFFGIKNRVPSLGRVLINPLSVSARLSQCPLRSESDQSAALPRIDAMIRFLATSTACVVYPLLTALRMHWRIFPGV